MNKIVYTLSLPRGTVAEGVENSVETGEEFVPGRVSFNHCMGTGSKHPLSFHPGQIAPNQGNGPHPPDTFYKTNNVQCLFITIDGICKNEIRQESEYFIFRTFAKGDAVDETVGFLAELCREQAEKFISGFFSSLVGTDEEYLSRIHRQDSSGNGHIVVHEKPYEVLLSQLSLSPRNNEFETVFLDPTAYSGHGDAT